MLPFIAGAVVGAAAVIAYNKSDKLKEGIDTGAKKVKTLAEEGFEKTKELAKDVKATVEDKVDKLKSKEADAKVAEVKGE